ncbi:MAG: hypothetical protein DI530_13145 [Sphingomonas sp.]|jgi:hypothetical protein|uniref:hypothetical protein n=1 Tax=Sphingomonas sp. TaxID=28214 RepID=UPI000DBBC46D|nr:hypothetical protein [Sphingomonas sp.]PZU77210.1 MAG: hypothetical protein DI530_13145 [Sphingomonas sp.]
MDATFHVAVDVDRDMVRTTLTGFFDAAAMRRYLDARAAAFGLLRCGPNEHLSLTDLREMMIQSQDMVGAFSATLADPAFRSRRLGFVIGSSLARMQLTRALGGRLGEHVRIFADMDAAEHWVLTGQDAPAAPAE